MAERKRGPDPEQFFPRNTIKEKSRPMPTTNISNLYASAEAAIKDMSGEAKDFLTAEAAELRAACAQASAGEDSLKPAESQRIMAAANSLRDVAGSFGYTLVSEVANSLYTLVANPRWNDRQVLTVVDLHADAIEAILRQNLKNDGGATGGAIVSSLRKAVHRFAANH
jgi:HPt (histidine-containing phosphotransfer) domain-containing protein